MIRIAHHDEGFARLPKSQQHITARARFGLLKQSLVAGQVLDRGVAVTNPIYFIVFRLCYAIVLGLLCLASCLRWQEWVNYTGFGHFVRDGQSLSLLNQNSK